MINPLLDFIVVCVCAKFQNDRCYGLKIILCDKYSDPRIQDGHPKLTGIWPQDFQGQGHIPTIKGDGEFTCPCTPIPPRLST